MTRCVTLMRCRYYTPNAYTDREGGAWKPWTAGPIAEKDLYARRFHPLRLKLINGILLHSLRFGDNKRMHRWDTINGWTN